MLKEHLVKQILTQMQTPGSKLFDINYVAHLKQPGPSQLSAVVTQWPGGLLCPPGGANPPEPNDKKKKRRGQILIVQFFFLWLVSVMQ